MDRVAQSVPVASCGSVSLPAQTPGGTPRELAGEDAYAKSPKIRLRCSTREIPVRRNLIRPREDFFKLSDSVRQKSLRNGWNEVATSTWR